MVSILFFIWVYSQSVDRRAGMEPTKGCAFLEPMFEESCCLRSDSYHRSICLSFWQNWIRSRRTRNFFRLLWNSNWCKISKISFEYWNTLKDQNRKLFAWKPYKLSVKSFSQHWKESQDIVFLSLRCLVQLFHQELDSFELPHARNLVQPDNEKILKVLKNYLIIHSPCKLSPNHQKISGKIIFCTIKSVKMVLSS